MILSPILSAIFIVLQLAAGRISCYFAGSNNSDELTELYEFEEEKNAEADCAELIFGGTLDQAQSLAVVRAADHLLSDDRARVSSPFSDAAFRLLRMMTGVSSREQLTATLSQPICEGMNCTDSLPRHDREFAPYSDENENSGSRGRHIKLEDARRIWEMIQQGKTMKDIRVHFKWYTHNYKRRIKKIAERGSDINPREDIDRFVWEQAREARFRMRIMRGWMIRSWGVSRARSIGYQGFRASTGWLHNFKKRHGIRSRKVTEVTNRSKLSQREQIDITARAAAREFTSNRFFQPERLILNMDQSPFNFEMTSDRTLSFVGERDTLITVDQANRATNSYTIQPMITRDGRPAGKLLICYKEPRNHGRFGPLVRQRVKELEKEYGNVVVYSSISGKMTNELMYDWLHDVLHPYVDRYAPGRPDSHSTPKPKNGTTESPEPVAGPSGLNPRSRPSSCPLQPQSWVDEPRGYLVADSWAGNLNERLQDNLLEAGINFLQVPKGTTSEVQPLDLDFFRQYKYIVRKLTDALNLHGRGSQIADRDGIINLHSLMWNQFAAPSWNNMVRRSWRHLDMSYQDRELSVAGVLRSREIHFSFPTGSTCEVENCTDHAFIACAHCGRLLCTDHLLNRTCFHEPEEDDLDEILFEAEKVNDIDEDEIYYGDGYYEGMGGSNSSVTMMDVGGSNTSSAVSTTTAESVTVPSNLSDAGLASYIHPSVINRLDLNGSDWDPEYLFRNSSVTTIKPTATTTENVTSTSVTTTNIPSSSTTPGPASSIGGSESAGRTILAAVGTGIAVGVGAGSVGASISATGAIGGGAAIGSSAIELVPLIQNEGHVVGPSATIEGHIDSAIDELPLQSRPHAVAPKAEGKIPRVPDKVQNTVIDHVHQLKRFFPVIKIQESNVDETYTPEENRTKPEVLHEISTSKPDEDVKPSSTDTPIEMMKSETSGPSLAIDRTMSTVETTSASEPAATSVVDENMELEEAIGTDQGPDDGINRYLNESQRALIDKMDVADLIHPKKMGMLPAVITAGRLIDGYINAAEAIEKCKNASCPTEPPPPISVEDPWARFRNGKKFEDSCFRHALPCEICMCGKKSSQLPTYLAAVGHKRFIEKESEEWFEQHPDADQCLPAKRRDWVCYCVGPEYRRFFYGPWRPMRPCESLADLIKSGLAPNT